MTQKTNFDEQKQMYLHFERLDSQHENIPINKTLKPSYRAFEIFAAKQLHAYRRICADVIFTFLLISIRLT